MILAFKKSEKISLTKAQVIFILILVICIKKCCWQRWKRSNKLYKLIKTSRRGYKKVLLDQSKKKIMNKIF